jgi:hypothetical protein
MSTIIPSGFYSQGLPTQVVVPDLPTGSLLAYWDAANTASFYSATGSGFTGSIWYDLSGNGYNLTQGGTRANVLRYEQDVFNTYPALYFSENVGTGLDTAYFTSSTAFVNAFDGSTDPNRNSGYYTASLGFTMFIVCQGDANGVDDGKMYQIGQGGLTLAGKGRMRSDNGNFTALTTTWNPGKTNYCAVVAAYGTNSPSETKVWATNSYFASSSFLDLVGGVYIWTLGQESFSSTANGLSNVSLTGCGAQTYGSGELIVGTNYVGSGQSFQGYIQSILVYSRTLSPEERYDVGQFFGFRQYSTNPFQIPT